MTIFKDTTQFILFPSVGFVSDDGYLCIAFAFMFYGISFRLLRLRKAEP